MTARQMLIRGRELARQTKLRKIATLLDFSPQFLRETFVFGGATGAMGYSSSFANTAESISGASRVSAVDHDSRESTEVVRQSRVFIPNRSSRQRKPDDRVA
ncbi:hypothetical protein AHF37_07261 [Paragonimus kellicotti]|nr:hypothetical protein AHF37_07261 [Paragonimus kellicotti]